MKEVKPIKVVFGLNDFLVGGMQRQFSEQIRHFNRERFEIVLITLFQFSGKENMYAALPKNLEVHTLSFNGFADVGEWWKLFRLLQRLRPDIVVSSLFFSNTVFRVLKPLVGYASVAREHNTFADRLSHWQRRVDKILSHLSY